MLLFLAFLLLVAAAAAINAALARDESSDGLARALRALEQHGDSTRDLAEDANRSFGERVIEPLQARAVGIGRRISGADAAER